MSWGAIGAFLAVLVVVSIIGHTWFNIVEGVLHRVKRLLEKKTPQVWHTLPPEPKKEDKKDV